MPGGGGLPTPLRRAMCCAYAGSGRQKTATRTCTGSTRGGSEFDASSCPLRGTAPEVTTARVAITLNPQILAAEDVKKGARGWTRATARYFLREFVAPADPSSFPIQEAGDARGRICKGSVVLPLEVARKVLGGP